MHSDTRMTTPTPNKRRRGGGNATPRSILNSTKIPSCGKNRVECTNIKENIKVVIDATTNFLKQFVTDNYRLAYLLNAVPPDYPYSFMLNNAACVLTVKDAGNISVGTKHPDNHVFSEIENLYFVTVNDHGRLEPTLCVTSSNIRTTKLCINIGNNGQTRQTRQTRQTAKVRLMYGGSSLDESFITSPFVMLAKAAAGFQLTYNKCDKNNTYLLNMNFERNSRGSASTQYTGFRFNATHDLPLQQYNNTMAPRPSTRAYMH